MSHWLSLIVPALVLLSSGALHANPVADLNVALFEGSGWTEKLANNQLSKARAVFDQCGIHWGKINFFNVSRAGGTAHLIKHDFNNRHSIAAVAEELKTLPRPLVVLIHSISDDEAQDLPVSHAKSIGSHKVYPEALLDTVWLPFSINTAKFKSDSSYNVLVYELVRVLTLDSQNNNDPSERRTDYLPDPLCESLRASRFVRQEAY